MVARFYPTGWRKRYGAEFDALLEEASPSWTDMLDVLQGALEMHLKTLRFRNIAVVCGLAGAILAGGMAFWMPDKYVSSAVIGMGSAGEKTALAEYINQRVQRALNRASLAELVRQFDLYPADRRRMPLEDVIERMRHDIRVGRIESVAGDSKRSAFIVQYMYGDPGQAQKITRELVAKVMAANVENRADIATFEVLDPASLPGTPVFPNRLMITAVGFGVGLLIAALTAVAIRLRRQAAQT
ncbi:MAG: hypothetical protein M3Z35_15860 [Nitrospirota bacterium]|nr:hypothetical protein [Nitrospirota bacterium]